MAADRKIDPNGIDTSSTFWSIKTDQTPTAAGYLGYAKKEAKKIWFEARQYHGWLSRTITFTDAEIIINVTPDVINIKITSVAPGMASGLVNIGQDIYPPGANTSAGPPSLMHRFYPGSYDSDGRNWEDTQRLNYSSQGAVTPLIPQVATIRPSMFTGKMEKAVSAILGTNSPVAWNWNWVQTHGIVTAGSQDWLVEVSEANGIMAMKMPTGSASGGAAANIGSNMGYFPGSASFPTGTALTAAIANGTVKQFATLSSDLVFRQFFTGRPIFIDMGWAFNSTGSECQNITILNVYGTLYAVRYKISFATSGSNITGYSISIEDEGVVYGGRNITSSNGRYADGSRLFIPTVTLNGNTSGFPVPSWSEAVFASPGPGIVSNPTTAPSKAPIYCFYDRTDAIQVFYQDVWAAKTYGPLNNFTGMPVYDAYPYPTFTYGTCCGSDFSGPGIPSYSTEPIYPPIQTLAINYSLTPMSAVMPAGYGSSSPFQLYGVRRTTAARNWTFDGSIYRNSLIIPAWDRSSIFVLAGNPSFANVQYQSDVSSVYFAGPVGYSGTVDSGFFGSNFTIYNIDVTAQGFGVGPGGPWGTNTYAIVKSNGNSFVSSSSPSAPPVGGCFGNLISIGKAGSTVSSISDWIQNESNYAYSMSWWNNTSLGSNARGFYPQAAYNGCFAGLYPDTMFAGSFADGLSLDPLISVSSGHSAFLGSSFSSAVPGGTPGGVESGFTINYTAMDSEPMTSLLSTPKPYLLNPLVVSWVGYS